MEAHGEGHMAPREGVTGKLLRINLYISWYAKKKKKTKTQNKNHNKNKGKEKYT